MAGTGRLPILPLFAQSGKWQVRLPPRRTTLERDRESEQPATGGPLTTAPENGQSNAT
jgi:hypothetical protein